MSQPSGTSGTLSSMVWYVGQILTCRMPDPVGSHCAQRRHWAHSERGEGWDRDDNVVPMGGAFGGLHMDMSGCWGGAMDAPDKERSLRLD